MSLDGQNVLDEYKTQIRTRAIAWDACIRFQLVTDADVKKIRAIDKAPKAAGAAAAAAAAAGGGGAEGVARKRAEIIESDAQGYAQLVLGDHGVLRKCANGNKGNKGDLVKYILMWTGDLLEGMSYPGVPVALRAG